MYVMKLVFARYFYHRLGGTNRKELVSWRVTPPLGFTDQSQTNSFSNLNIYICILARFIYACLGLRPPPPRSAGISCEVTTIESFTSPEKLPRLPCPRGSLAVPRGSESLGEGREPRPRDRSEKGERQAYKVPGPQFTTPLFHGKMEHSAPSARGGEVGGTLRSGLGKTTRAQPPESRTPGAALRELQQTGVPPLRRRVTAWPIS